MFGLFSGKRRIGAKALDAAVREARPGVGQGQSVVEGLEGRRLFSWSCVDDGFGNVTVTGDSASDTVSVGIQGGYYGVEVSGSQTFSCSGNYNNSGSFVVNAGGGDDVITVVNTGYSPPEIHGGDGNDYISGSEEGDNLYGDAGNDTIYGGLGNDNIDGGDGNDSLDGANDYDNVSGGDGDDYINGVDGNAESISGGNGNDTVDADNGLDGLFDVETEIWH